MCFAFESKLFKYTSCVLEYERHHCNIKACVINCENCADNLNTRENLLYKAKLFYVALAQAALLITQTEEDRMLGVLRNLYLRC